MAKFVGILYSEGVAGCKSVGITNSVGVLYEGGAWDEGKGGLDGCQPAKHPYPTTSAASNQSKQILADKQASSLTGTPGVSVRF